MQTGVLLAPFFATNPAAKYHRLVRFLHPVHRGAKGWVTRGMTLPKPVWYSPVPGRLFYFYYIISDLIQSF